MKEVSSTYKALRADLNSTYEVKVVQGSTTYGMDDIMSLRTYPMLFDGERPAIGNACATECELHLVESTENWARMAEFEVFFRLVSGDGETESEWVSAGIYYTDTREESAGGFLTIHAYDKMLTLEQTWADKINSANMPTAWPITAAEAVELALSVQDEIELDEDAELDDTVAFIGLDETATIRKTLQDVATGMGGNWYLSGETLKFIPLKRDYDAIAIAGIAVAGIAVVGTTGGSAGGDILFVGTNVATYHFSKPLDGISGVEITAEDGTLATAGTDDGYILQADGDFSSSSVASLCLSKVSGAEYRPFEITGAEIDPVCEPGDMIEVEGTLYTVCALEFNFGHAFLTVAKAPYDEEVDHEYNILSENKKTLRKALGAVKELQEMTDEELQNLELQFGSSIQQTATAIRTEVSEGYYGKSATDQMISGVQSRITQSANGLEVSINNVRVEANRQVNEIKQYVRYVNGTVIVGTTEHQQDFRVSPTQLAACYNGEPASYWNQDEQVTPKKLRIPVGGSLQEGDFIWQPRSSGNLSLMWVGEDE